MKPFLSIALSVLAIMQFTTSNCQDTLKNFNNRWSTELNFNPFNGNLSLNNANGQIKLRYFEPSGMAWRIALSLSYDQNNENEENVYGSNPYKNNSTQKAFFAGFNIGREKHFAGTRRLSPYIGWEVGVGLKTSSQKSSDDIKTTEVDGAWINYVQVQNPQYNSYQNSQYQSQFYTYQTYNNRGFWSVGANFVTGFDFYMSQKFYLGYELLVGLDYTSFSNIEITQKYKSTQYGSSNDFNSPDKDDESWKFGPKLMNGIRIGFVF